MKGSTLIVVGVLVVSGASAYGQAINDAQIAHIIVTANQVDIDPGKLAASITP